MLARRWKLLRSCIRVCLTDMWLQVAKTKVAMQSWHGSLRPRRYWNLAHIGRGNDQYGPGWYFTSNEETAKVYGRYVHSCTIDLSEANAADQIGEAIEYEDQIEKLIAESPGFQTNYYDWDDNPGRALRQATLGYCSSAENVYEALLMIHGDLYPESADLWSQKVSQIFGWDGAIIPVNNETFLVVWNPAVIHVDEMQDQAPGEAEPEPKEHDFGAMYGNESDRNSE